MGERESISMGSLWWITESHKSVVIRWLWLLFTICLIDFPCPKILGFLLFYDVGYSCLYVIPRIETSVMPYGIHAKARLGNPDPRNAREELVLPAVNFQPPLLVIGDGDPVVGPRAW